MNTITSVAAAEHRNDLLHAARRPRLDPSATIPGVTQTIALRVAGGDEAAVVRELAALDDARAPRGQVLLAVVDGEPVAALSLDDGRVVANPFVATEHAVSLLRVRHEHLLGISRRRRRWRSILRPRLA